MLLTAKILLTALTLNYSVVPAIIDLGVQGDGHLGDPAWPAHARYHFVWSLVSYNLIAVLALCMIWAAGSDGRRLRVPALLALAVHAGFAITHATRPLHGGAL